ncbi:MAG: hypothetical protein GY769_07720 [bacterium]|nr:hypothetical protein [bacterium]
MAESRMQKTYSLEDIEVAMQNEDANIVRLQQAVSAHIQRKNELMEIKKELLKRARDAERSVIVIPAPPRRG